MNKIAIAIHGGAGTILKCQMTPAKEDAYVKALDKSLTSAYLILTNGGSSLDAVETAVIQMEGKLTEKCSPSQVIFLMNNDVV